MKNLCKILKLKGKTRKNPPKTNKQNLIQKNVQTKQREEVKLNIPFHLGVFLKYYQQEYYHSWPAPKKHLRFDKSAFSDRKLYNQKNINQRFCIRRADGL